MQYPGDVLAYYCLPGRDACQQPQLRSLSLLPNQIQYQDRTCALPYFHYTQRQHCNATCISTMMTTGNASGSVREPVLSPRQDWTSEEYEKLPFKVRWAELEPHLRAPNLLSSIRTMSKDQVANLRLKIDSVKVTEFPRAGDSYHFNLWEPIAVACTRRRGELDMIERGGPSSTTQQFQTQRAKVAPPAAKRTKFGLSDLRQKVHLPRGTASATQHVPPGRSAYGLSKLPILRSLQKRAP